MKKIMASLSLFFMNISFATAHTQGSVLTGMVAGTLHPLTGADHLVALIAIGMLASRRTGVIKQILLPLVFLSTLFVGFAVAQTDQFMVLAENIIVISLGVLVLLLFFGNTHRNTWLPLLIAIFGMAHGHAHGIEAVGSPLLFASGMLFSCGMLMTTIVIICNRDKIFSSKYCENVA